MVLLLECVSYDYVKSPILTRPTALDLYKRMYGILSANGGDVRTHGFTVGSVKVVNVVPKVALYRVNSQISYHYRQFVIKAILLVIYHQHLLPSDSIYYDQC